MQDSLPAILIPYEGPCHDHGVQDIFIYLRPESNGVKVESTTLKAIKDFPTQGQSLHIAYMANIPGSFIIQQHTIEEHYSLKLRFAKQGRKAFTPTMKEGFENHFHIPFDEAQVIGAFDALEELKLSYDQLFRLWVPDQDFFRIHGQTIKKYGKYFIINYDIPALLHKNNRKTNIFVMILRSFLSYKENHSLMDFIYRALTREEIMSDRMPLSYILHYSKGPFEQILDGIGYVYEHKLEHVPLTNLSFFAYLISKECRDDEILSAIRNPIMEFQTCSGLMEKNLFDYTYGDSFPAAYEKFLQRK